MTHDGLGKYLSQIIEKAPGPTADIVEHPQGHQDRRRRQLPAGGQRGGDEVVRRADPRGRLRLRELHPGLHRPRAATGRSASQSAACRSSATTSSPRSARRSCTACSRASSASAACGSSARASSTSAATPTSSTCSSASGSSRRRSPRRTRSPSSSTTTWARRTSTSGRATTSRGSTDRKWAYIRMEGRTFGDVPLEHRAQARGVGLAELGRRRHRRGPLREARARPRPQRARSRVRRSYFMKSPPIQHPDDECRASPRSSSPAKAAARLPSARASRRRRPASGRRRRTARRDADTEA